MRDDEPTVDPGERSLRRRRHIEHLLAYGLQVDEITEALELPRAAVVRAAVRWRAEQPARSRPPAPPLVLTLTAPEHQALARVTAALRDEAAALHTATLPRVLALVADDLDGLCPRPRLAAVSS